MKNDPPGMIENEPRGWKTIPGMIESEAPRMKNAPGVIENEAKTMENHENYGGPLKKHRGARYLGGVVPGELGTPWRAANRYSRGRACCRATLHTGRAAW